MFFFRFCLLAGVCLIAYACKSPKSATDSSNIEALDQQPLESSQAADQSVIRLQKEKEIRSYQPSARRDFDILHTDLDLEFDWKNQVVIGRARIQAKPYTSPEKIFVLDAKDFELGAISLIEGDSTQKLSYRYDEKQISVFLPREFNSKDTFEIEINYKAFPERNAGRVWL